MKNLSFTFLAFAVLLFTSCKKEDNNTVPDCETNKYGVVKVSFGANNVKHGILITSVGGINAKDKIVEIGKTSDTVRLALGNYIINVSSLNNSDEALEDETFTNKSITLCSETNLQVNF